MIVCSKFEEDVDEKLMWEQCDVYHRALRVIVKKSDQMAAFARNLLADEIHTGWGEHDNDNYDHRTLQGAHDLIAAAWRYRFAPSDRVFSFAEENPEFSADYSEMHGWQRWLNEEVDSWIHAPHLVRSIQVILTHQNDDAGYRAEDQLFKDLVRRFHDVPWNKMVLDACQRAS